jgi:hypothetical protein
MPEMGIGNKSPGKRSVDGNLPVSPELFREGCCKRLDPGSRTGGEAPCPGLSMGVSVVPKADKGSFLPGIPVSGRTLREH